jgi:starch synthase
MYSLRYGTVPVVRATGGLYDTVRNFDPVSGAGTGFTFDDYTPQALLDTLQWALSVYEDKPMWRRIQQTGMQQDFSWDASAREYVGVYEKVIGHGAKVTGTPDVPPFDL